MLYIIDEHMQFFFLLFYFTHGLTQEEEAVCLSVLVSDHPIVIQNSWSVSLQTNWRDVPISSRLITVL